LSSDKLSSESDAESDSDSEALADVRIWYATDLQNPPIAPARFPFNGKPKLQAFLTDCNDPLEYLRLFIDDNVINVIVRETNRYTDADPDASTKTVAYSAVGASDQRRRLAVHRNFGAAGHNTKATTTLVLVKQPSICKIMSEYRLSLIIKLQKIKTKAKTTYDNIKA